MSAAEECERSGMPRAWCAHCLGHEWAGEPVELTQPRTPAPPRKARPLVVEKAPATRAAPAPLGRAAYPALCALGPDCRPHDPDHPRPTDGRSHVCAVCEDRAREALSSTAAVWVDLEKALTNLPAVDASRERTTGTGLSVGIRLNEAALEARTFITQVAHGWARLVRTQRGTLPSEDATTPGLLGWVARGHVSWLLRHPDPGVAVKFARDTTECWRLARRVAYPAGWRRVSIPDAVCTVMVRPDREQGDEFEPYRCGQPLHAMIRPDMGLLPDLECDHGHHTPPDVWRRHNWKGRPVDKP